MTRIQKRSSAQSKGLCTILSEAWIWIFGATLFVIFGTLMLQTSEDIVASSHHNNLLQLSFVQGSLSCSQAQENVASGIWFDPNRGTIYARELITEPHFQVSLHNEQYDNVRWKTIMKDGKYYEDDVHARFMEILQNKPRSLVVDVGANIGYYTLLSAALGHDVISFEPNPANIVRICDSLRLNDWSHRNIHLFQCAVSDEEGEMNLFIPKNPGAAVLKDLDYNLDHADKEHQAKTKVITLDSFAQEQGWFDRSDITIEILKIDVEGKDPNVVLGASRLLSSMVKNVLTEARRFGRPNLFASLVTLYETGFTLKDPVVTLKGTTPKEYAQSVVDYFQQKWGKDSMRTADLWWVKVE